MRSQSRRLHFDDVCAALSGVDHQSAAVFAGGADTLLALLFVLLKVGVPLALLLMALLLLVLLVVSLLSL